MGLVNEKKPRRRTKKLIYEGPTRYCRECNEPIEKKEYKKGQYEKRSFCSFECNVRNASKGTFNRRLWLSVDRRTNSQ